MLKQNKLRVFKEKLHATVFSGFLYAQKLFSAKTPYQKIDIYAHDTLGKVLALDGIVQLCTQDEFIFHESVAFWPFFVKDDIKKILIVGGGDLGTAIRLMQLPRDISVTLVEIDEKVTEASLAHIFPKDRGVLNDPRLHIVYRDAVDYVAQTDEAYDLIILDSTDDCGVGSVLYANPFIRRLKDRLTHGGVLMRLSGSYFLQQKEFKKIRTQSENIFGKTSVGSLYIPLNMYQGGLYTVNVCMKDVAFTYEPAQDFTPPGVWYSRARHLGISTFL